MINKIKKAINRIKFLHLLAGTALAYCGTTSLALAAWQWEFIYRGMLFPDLAGRWPTLIVTTFVTSLIVGTITAFRNEWDK